MPVDRERSGVDPGPPGSCVAGDQRAIRQIGDSFTYYWRNNDGKGLASLWALLGDIRHPDESVERTRQAILINRMALFKRREYQASRHMLQVGVIRCLSEDIAVADGKWELRDVFDANGQQVPAMKGLFTLVVKRDGGCRIESYRYTVDSAEPAGPTQLKHPGYPGRGGGPPAR